MTGEINLLEKLPKPAGSSRELNHKRVGWILMTVFLAVGLLANLFTSTLMDHIQPDEPLAILVYTSLGPMFGAPLACLCIAGMLQQPWYIRMVITGVSVAFFASAFAIGASISSEFEMLNPGELVPMIPILTLGCCLPFLTVRHLRDWQLVFESLGDLPSRQNLSVAGLMIATAVAGFCIVSTQMCPQPEIGFIVAAIVAGVGFCVFLPMFGFVMRSNSPVIAMLVCYIIGGILGVLVLGGINYFVSILSGYGRLFGFGHSIGMMALFFAMGVASCRRLGAKLVDRNDMIRQ